MASPFLRSVAGRTCLVARADRFEVHGNLRIVIDGVALERSIRSRAKACTQHQSGPSCIFLPKLIDQIAQNIMNLVESHANGH
jgi:hypothetical protein